MSALLVRLGRFFDGVRYRFVSVIRPSLARDKTVPRVMFGFGPRRGSAAILKAAKLKVLFGNAVYDNNLLYICSGNIPLWYCKKEKNHGVKIIVNQNGVFYPGWYGQKYQEANEKYLLGHYQLADFVVYQSRFCRESAEIYLGKAPCASDVIYNPVDTEYFQPPAKIKFSLDHTVLLTTGIFYSEVKQDRLKLLLECFVLLRKEYPNIRLVIAGSLTESLYKEAQKIIRNNAAQRHVKILCSYDYKTAPLIYGMGDIYINTQFNDSCPSGVLEAMSSGLPVVYLDCGGTPELVGNAGVGVKVQKSWEVWEYPKPEDVKKAVLDVAKGYEDYSRRARQRCVEIFDQKIWKRRHDEIFTRILR